MKGRVIEMLMLGSQIETSGPLGQYNLKTDDPSALKHVGRWAIGPVPILSLV